MNNLWHHIDNILFPFFRCDMRRPSSMPRRFTKKRAVPHLPSEIWLEIFQFATYLRHAKTIEPMDPFIHTQLSNNVMAANSHHSSWRTKSVLVLVCRTWRKIAVQLLYEHIVITSPRRARQIRRALSANCHDSGDVPSSCSERKSGTSEYGRWTRHLEIFTHARGTKTLEYLHLVFEIMKLCPNVRMLSGNWTAEAPIEFITGVAQLYSMSLQGLYWNECSSSLNFTPLGFLTAFQALTILDLRHYYGTTKPRNTLSQLPPLPVLHSLVVSTNFTSLDAANLLDLPSLRSVTIEVTLDPVVVETSLSTFLRRHGPPLESVEIVSSVPSSADRDGEDAVQYPSHHLCPNKFLATGICPNLRSLTFSAATHVFAPHPHPHLRRIGLRGINPDHLYPNKESTTKSHLMAISRDCFPKLEVVRTIGFLVDAATDSLITDIFIWWSEKFDEQGIDFQDGEGVLWFYTDNDPEIMPKEDVNSKVHEFKSKSIVSP